MTYEILEEVALIGEAFRIAKNDDKYWVFKTWHGKELNSTMLLGVFLDIVSAREYIVCTIQTSLN